MTIFGKNNDRPTILIVDDTPENIAILGELLEPHFTVRVAVNGANALAAVKSHPCPDLILLDVMMPEINGYTVLSRLREDSKTAEIPVIFVTSLDATDDESYGLALGAADYITKPLRPAIVLARVRAQIELKQARDRMHDQNVWLEAEVCRRMKQNQLIQDVSIRALASLAETRDNETGYHILRTQGYVAVLCQALSDTEYCEQLSAKDIDLISKAAPLHDIGKVGIPDHILLKPGKLTENEWVIMRTHTTLGAGAIRRAIQDQQDETAFDFLHVAIAIALCHHEKWDGSGYPEGLQGQDIPLSARLMALADVFDALINRRCYKEPMPMEQAIAIILAEKGKHFDPKIVDAFISCQDQFLAIAQRHADP